MENVLVASLTSQTIEKLSDQQERELVTRCQDGDRNAMEHLVRQYQHWVYNIAYGMLSNPEDASDMAQDIFLWMWENIGQFQFRSRFSTWLYRIVINRCINLKDQRKRRKTEPAEIDDSQPWAPVDTTSPSREVLRAEQQQLLQKALEQLRDDYRQVIILREMQDLSYDELADALGCSVGRVKSRLHEARKALRNLILKLDR